MSTVGVPLEMCPSCIQIESSSKAEAVPARMHASLEESDDNPKFMSIHVSFVGPKGIRMAHSQLKAMHAVFRRSMTDIPRSFAASEDVLHTYISHAQHSPYDACLCSKERLVWSKWAEHAILGWPDGSISFSVLFHPKVFQ